MHDRKPERIGTERLSRPAQAVGGEGPALDQAGALLTIDLNAIRENFRRLRARLGGKECAGVVKADGYGLGAARVAAALVKEGCRQFFVAHAAEGIALRQALGAGPEIFVLNGIFAGTEDECADAGLTAVANSLGQLASWREAAARRRENLPVAVQVDTGMSRLGMMPAEVDHLGAGAFDGLVLRLVMSHLARADEPDSPANEIQRVAFETLRRKLPPAPASLANSSGIFLGDDYRHDLARPGAALYGINPLPGRQNPMLPVVRLQAKVIQTRDLDADIGVGYGHSFRTTGPFRAATISLGYGDGWPRHAAASVWVDGVSVPFIGRISMDSIILDISSLAPGRLKAGDMVELIGPQQSIDDLAALAGTIGYEILTGLGRRFHRRYEGS